MSVGSSACAIRRALSVSGRKEEPPPPEERDHVPRWESDEQERDPQPNAHASIMQAVATNVNPGIATTGIKRGLTSRALARAAITLMSRVNTIGADLAERGLVRAATDVTGFGLLGHLASMCRASGVSAEIFAHDVPAISEEIFELIERDCVPGGTKENLKTASALMEWKRTPISRRLLLADAQTSGGLLLCVPPRRLEEVRRL